VRPIGEDFEPPTVGRMRPLHKPLTQRRGAACLRIHIEAGVVAKHAKLRAVHCVSQPLMCERIVQARQGARRPLEIEQSVAAIVERLGGVGPYLDHPVETRQRVRGPPEL
jgi:hypothetical protein